MKRTFLAVLLFLLPIAPAYFAGKHSIRPVNVVVKAPPPPENATWKREDEIHIVDGRILGGDVTMGFTVDFASVGFGCGQRPNLPKARTYPSVKAAKDDLGKDCGVVGFTTDDGKNFQPLI